MRIQLHRSSWASRVCRMCGRTFMGKPNAWYCPDCRVERKRKRDRVIGRENCVDCGAQLEPGHSPNRMLCKMCAGLHRQYGEYCSNGKKAGRSVLSFDEWKAEQVGKAQCPMCGRLFTPRTKRQKYCSKECSKKAAAERVLRAYHAAHPRPERVCPVCGRQFFNGDHHYEKYCSPECRAIGRRQKMAARLEPDAPPVVTKPRWQPKPEVKKICPVCGKMFITTYSSKKYCSIKCRNREMARRAHEKQKRDTKKS